MKFFVIIFILFFCSRIKSQQTVQYTQYILNYFALNPALAGSKKCMDVKLGYRSQWLGFEGAPKTAFASFNGELKFKKKKNVRIKHGVGAYVESDAIGPTSTTTLYLAYAYHYPVGRDITASVGIFAGIQQLRLDATKVTVINNQDPAIGGSGSRFLIPDVTPGIFLNHKDWFTGFSIRQVVPTKWKIIGTNQTKNTFHYLLVGGKRFETNRDINVVPSALLKWTGYTNPALDLNLMFELNNYLELGASWRNGDAIAGLVKIKFLNFFSLGYSFDFTTSKLRYGSSNTHELIIGIYACPQNTSEYDCPAFN